MLGTLFKGRLEKIFNDNTPLLADEIFNEINHTVVLGRKSEISSGKVVLAYESLERYEHILNEIYNWNEDIYKFVHKGTPFYFCGIHSFDIGSYEKALFYFDAAISEDIKNKPINDTFHWDNSAAFAFYKLNKDYNNPIVKIPTEKFIKILKPLLKEFSETINVKFELEDFIEKFTKRRVQSDNHISVISSFFIFLYQFELKSYQIKIRSDRGGSIEPFLSHLFNGSLIVETLLKLTYPNYGKDMGSLLGNSTIKSDLDFGLSSKVKDLIGGTAGKREDLEKILRLMLPYLEVNNIPEHERWIITTYAIRNVTSHSLYWIDIFTTENYEKLFKSILFSIFYIIYKKY